MQAEDLFLNTNPDADGKRRVLAAWRNLEEEASRVEPDHSLVGAAQIKQASMLYRLGLNYRALAAVRAGLATFPRTDPFILPTHGEGVALLGTVPAQAGQAEEAIAADTLAGCVARAGWVKLRRLHGSRSAAL
ncbi:MAG: hypothetical protein HRT64_03655 [Erythrobacter sp.]|nr:hypothetical protein [Erythrobacter sp.]